MSEFREHVAYLAREEKDHLPLVWWWMSFVDPDRPEGERFLGACIVQAHGPVTAGIESHAQKCNPGGQSRSLPFPPRVDASEWANTLLSCEDVHRFDQWMTDHYPHSP